MRRAKPPSKTWLSECTEGPDLGPGLSFIYLRNTPSGLAFGLPLSSSAMNFNGHIAILGAGNMGTALAHLISGNGHQVMLWDYFTEVVAEINVRRINSRYLQGIKLSDRVRAVESQADCVYGARMLVIALPSAFIVGALAEVREVLPSDVSILNVAKGVLPDSHQPIALKLASMVGEDRLTLLGGPAIANEFSRGMQTSVVLASDNAARSASWRTVLQNDFFHITETHDVTGVCLGGILKNVYAILLGYLGVLGGGKNLEAAVMSAALREMTALSTAKGATPGTICGLAGLGDLVATGFSPDSHNRSFGRKLGGNPPFSDHAGLLPEGAKSVHSVCCWAEELQVCMPLAQMVRSLVDGRRPALAEVSRAAH